MQRDELGHWSFLPYQIPQTNLNLLTVSQKYAVRPILMLEKHHTGKELGRIFSIDSTDFGQVEFVSLNLDRILTDWLITPLRGLQYLVGATQYHCMRLANLYAETWREFYNPPFSLMNHKSDISFFVRLGSEEESYYEFDALITAAIRCYEAMRFPIWSVFGSRNGIVPKSGPRKNFEDTLNACENLPSTLKDSLRQNWASYGKKAKSYRDYIQHYFPLDRGFSQARMERLDENVWATSFLVPDNPEDKSPKKFRYDHKVDALTYGWELTDRLFLLVKLLTIEISNVLNSGTG